MDKEWFRELNSEIADGIILSKNYLRILIGNTGSIDFSGELVCLGYQIEGGSLISSDALIGLIGAAVEVDVLDTKFILRAGKYCFEVDLVDDGVEKVLLWVGNQWGAFS